jgi:hypothetical protein
MTTSRSAATTVPRQHGPIARLLPIIGQVVNLPQQPWLDMLGGMRR